MKKTLYALFAAMAMTMGILTTVQGTAAAAAAPTSASAVQEDVTIMGWPSGCADGKWDNGWYGGCSHGNGGSWQVFVTCRPEGGGSTFTRNGLWKTRGNSYVSCPTLSYAINGGLWTSPTT